MDYVGELWYNGGMVPSNPGSPASPSVDEQNAEILERFRRLTLHDSPDVRLITDSIRSRINIAMGGIADPIIYDNPQAIQQEVLRRIDREPDFALKNLLIKNIDAHADHLDQALASPLLANTPPTPDALQRFLNMERSDPESLLIIEKIRRQINDVLEEDNVTFSKLNQYMPRYSAGHRQGTNDVMELQYASFQEAVPILLQKVAVSTRLKILQVLEANVPAPAPIQPTPANDPNVQLAVVDSTATPNAQNTTQAAAAVAEEPSRPNFGAAMMGSPMYMPGTSEPLTAPIKYVVRALSSDPERTWKNWAKDFVSPAAWYKHSALISGPIKASKFAFGALNSFAGPQKGVVWKFLNGLMTSNYSPLSWINIFNSNFVASADETAKKS